MLTFLAYAMVVAFMVLIMTKRLSALTALILVPIAFGMLGGFSAHGVFAQGVRVLDPSRTLTP